MQISDGKAVQIDYTLRNDAGQILDSSEGRQPLAYLQGAGNIIAGLEAALEGKGAGDTLSVSIPPAQGYGERDDTRILTVGLSQFPDPKQAQLGAQFGIQTDQGAHIATVTAVVGDQVRLDLNHPLAGETLHFDVTVSDIRNATPEEIEHGHAHQPGGHCH